MTRRHGTPAEFRKAVFAALDMVTYNEAKIAADKYEREWCAAGRREAIAAEEGRGDGRAR